MKEIVIPEGYEARIEGNKVILEPKESEDERIKKDIIAFLQSMNSHCNPTQDWDLRNRWIPYLERQKEQSFAHHEIDESLRDAVTHQMEDDGDVDDFVRRGIDDIVLKYAELGARWQKEQNLADIDLDTIVIELEETIGTSPHSRETIKDFFQKATQKYMDCLRIANSRIGELIEENYYLKEQQPAEWSEEDETYLEYVLWCVMKTRQFVAKDACDLDACKYAERWLESLPKRFNLQFYWKPSEQEKGALQTAIHVLTEERNFPKAAAHLQNILDAFEGKESRRSKK